MWVVSITDDANALIRTPSLRMSMAPVFHWVKVKIVCYATEDEDLLHDVVVRLTGIEDDEAYDVDISEGLHGNPITVIDANLTHNKDCERVFKNLGKDILESIEPQLEERIDDDDIFYMRLDKQKAVLGEYELSHSGDVISITAKIAAHPAKKEIAVGLMRDYLIKLIRSDAPQVSQ